MAYYYTSCLYWILSDWRTIPTKQCQSPCTILRSDLARQKIETCCRRSTVDCILRACIWTGLSDDLHNNVYATVSPIYLFIDV